MTIFACLNMACPGYLVIVHVALPPGVMYRCPSCSAHMTRSEEARYPTDCGDYTLTVVPEWP